MVEGWRGTEHLLLGLLQQESLAAQILRERSAEVHVVWDQLEDPVPSRQTPKRCKACRHLIVDGEPDKLNLFCGASPIRPEFDCYTGEFKNPAADRRGDPYQHRIHVNFGECRLFEPKQQDREQSPGA
jgi:hypothetical protein